MVPDCYWLYVDLQLWSMRCHPGQALAASYSVAHSPVKPQSDAKRSISGRFRRSSPSASRVPKRNATASRRSWLSWRCRTVGVESHEVPPGSWVNGRGSGGWWWLVTVDDGWKPSFTKKNTKMKEKCLKTFICKEGEPDLQCFAFCELSDSLTPLDPTAPILLDRLADLLQLGLPEPRIIAHIRTSTAANIGTHKQTQSFPQIRSNKT